MYARGHPLNRPATKARVHSAQSTPAVSTDSSIQSIRAGDSGGQAGLFGFDGGHGGNGGQGGGGSGGPSIGILVKGEAPSQSGNTFALGTRRPGPAETPVPGRALGPRGPWRLELQWALTGWRWPREQDTGLRRYLDRQGCLMSRYRALLVSYYPNNTRRPVSSRSLATVSVVGAVSGRGTLGPTGP